MFFQISVLLLIPHLLLADSSSANLNRIGTKPTSCPLNEVPSDCIEYCLPTCEQPKQPPCTYNTCFAGCMCKEGYIRVKEGAKCVPIKSCVESGEISRNYTAPCKENEELQDCVGCEATCPSIDDPVECWLSWCPRACACKYGFIRKNYGGDCISESECRRLHRRFFKL
ncbi:zonadhesin-like [Zophobas morio]|uniref:zonadhesin-like n=1 Tax=Zophobas morio TaxID=2755281 RepID=UPI003083ABF3